MRFTLVVTAALYLVSGGPAFSQQIGVPIVIHGYEGMCPVQSVIEQARQNISRSSLDYIRCR